MEEKTYTLGQMLDFAEFAQPFIRHDIDKWELNMPKGDGVPVYYTLAEVLEMFEKEFNL